MLEFDTLYLLLAMAGFIILAVVLVHKHKCDDLVRRKRNEVQSITLALESKIVTLERETVDLQLQIDDIDQQIESLQEKAEP